MRLLRRHRHTWSAWSEPVVLGGTSKRYVLQRRRCQDETCNLAEERFL